jgi:putative component of toxin-antitoxin plasmid stabilization module
MQGMNTFLKSNEFDAWLVGLKDQVGKAIIAKRIRNAEMGNFGDCEPLGEGVFEMRIHFGPGKNPLLNPLPKGEEAIALSPSGGKVDRGLALILLVAERWFIFCCWAVINRPRNVTSSVPGKWRALYPRSEP